MSIFWREYINDLRSVYVGYSVKGDYMPRMVESKHVREKATLVAWNGMRLLREHR